jgi:nucleotide-binding universal stress UspA family protein
MTALSVVTGRPAVHVRPGFGQGGQRLDTGSVRRRHAHRVVVGVDGSPNSLAALGRAITQARLRDAELDVVRVIPEDADESAAAAARAGLRGLIARLGPDRPDVPVRLRVERGEPAAVLLVVSAGAELLVIGARAHSARGNMFGGDTVPRCLDYAQCHVDVCADHHGDN